MFSTALPITLGLFQLLEVNHLPHTVHNPYCNITQGKFKDEKGKLFLFTYVNDLENSQSSYEYYSGENYIVESKDKSNSHQYNTFTIPAKYREIAVTLLTHYNNNTWPEYNRE